MESGVDHGAHQEKQRCQSILARTFFSEDNPLKYGASSCILHEPMAPASPILQLCLLRVCAPGLLMLLLIRNYQHAADLIIRRRQLLFLVRKITDDISEGISSSTVSLETHEKMRNRI